MSQKVEAGRGKALLRRVLARHVPPGLTERPKMGFGVPLDAWLRGPLRGSGRKIFSSPGACGQTAYSTRPRLRQMWLRRHQHGQEALQYALWPVIMFQAWLRA